MERQRGHFTLEGMDGETIVIQGESVVVDPDLDWTGYEPEAEQLAYGSVMEARKVGMLLMAKVIDPTKPVLHHLCSTVFGTKRLREAMGPERARRFSRRVGRTPLSPVLLH